MIWVSLIIMLFFFLAGLILMSMDGILTRFVAIPCMAFCLPIISAQQVIWTEGPLAIQTISLPPLVTGNLFIFFTIMLYAATLNWFELPAIKRDYLGRKK